MIDELPAEYALNLDNVVPYQRVQVFQLEALKVLVSKVISVMQWPTSSLALRGQKLYLVNEVTRQQHIFPQPAVVYVSKHNMGAMKMAMALDEWQQRPSAGEASIFVLTECPWTRAKRAARRQSLAGRAIGAVRESVRQSIRRSSVMGANGPESQMHEAVHLKQGATQPEYMIIYLNSQTWSSAEFVDDVWLARKTKTKMVLVHEQDPREHACEFGAFFKSTPQELLDDGIYAPLAVPWHAEPLRGVSLVLVAKALGGEQVHKSLVQKCHARLKPSSLFGGKEDVNLPLKKYMEGIGWRKALHEAATIEKEKAAAFDAAQQALIEKAAADDAAGAQRPQSPSATSDAPATEGNRLRGSVRESTREVLSRLNGSRDVARAKDEHDNEPSSRMSGSCRSAAAHNRLKRWSRMSDSERSSLRADDEGKDSDDRREARCLSGDEHIKAKPGRMCAAANVTAGGDATMQGWGAIRGGLTAQAQFLRGVSEARASELPAPTALPAPSTCSEGNEDATSRRRQRKSCFYGDDSVEDAKDRPDFRRQLSSGKLQQLSCPTARRSPSVTALDTARLRAKIEDVRTSKQMKGAQEALERANAIAAAASTLDQARPHMVKQRSRRVQLFDAAREREEQDLAMKKQDLTMRTGASDDESPAAAASPETFREGSLTRRRQPVAITETATKDRSSASADPDVEAVTGTTPPCGIQTSAHQMLSGKDMVAGSTARRRSTLSRRPDAGAGSERCSALPLPSALPPPSSAWRRVSLKDVISAQGGTSSEPSSPPPQQPPPNAAAGSDCRSALPPGAMPLPSSLPPPSSAWQTLRAKNIVAAQAAPSSEPCLSPGAGSDHCSALPSSTKLPSSTADLGQHLSGCKMPAGTSVSI